MRSIGLFSLFFIIKFSLFAQTQGIAYTAVGKGAATTFVTDYHSIGINSSALGWKSEYEKKFTLGTSEFGFGIYSDALNVQKLRSLYKNVQTNMTGGENSQASREEQQQFAKDFANSNVLISANYNWFGASYQNEKLGGIAFSINEDYQWDSKMGARTADLLFNGKYASIFDSLTVVFGSDTTRIPNDGSASADTLENVISGNFAVPVSIAYLSEGTRVRTQWTRSYNLAYGRKLFGRDSVFVVYGGIAGRFIQSVAVFDLESNGSSVTMSSSVSPTFDINYSQAAANSNSFSGTNAGGFPPKAVGNGYGVDISLSAILFNKLTIAAAVNNIGSVTYTRNVYSVRDTLISSYSLEGLDDNNITQALNSFLRDGGMINLEGEEKYTSQNAANFRAGASLKLNQFLNFGFDIVAPFDREAPGSIANPVYAFGGEVRPVKWLALSAGYFGGGIYKNNVPVGINFILGKGTYEFGVSSRDMLSFFLEDSNSVSMALGFMRFRF